MAIKLGKGLELPLEAVTQTFGLIGHKGSGKSYAAGKLVEEFLRNKAQVVILDPIGIWHGLRTLKNGKPSQFNVPILGGLHQDAPLEPEAGTTVADFVVETGTSVILDVSTMRKAKRKVFVAAFAEQLFLRQKTERSAMHLVIEEAQVFCPQSAQGGEQRMLGAFQDIVRLGRNVGIGVSLITQRPQSVHKEVLNMAEPLMVFRLIAKHERKAITEWLEHVGSEADDAMKELPNLQTGDFYFWSPSWLEQFKKGRVYTKKTADVSATPKVGDKTVKLQRKPVDLDKLTADMSESIERAQQNDPKVLKKEIKRLERYVQELEAAAGNATELKALRVAHRAELGQLRKQFGEWSHSTMRTADQYLDEVKLNLVNMFMVPVATMQVDSDYPAPKKARPYLSKAIAESTAAKVKQSSVVVGSSDFKLKPSHTRVLKSLYWLRDDPTRTPKRVAFFAKYTVSGNFNNLMGNLRGAGYVTGWQITANGINEIADVAGERPTGEELMSWMSDFLKPSEYKLLEVLYDAEGERLSSAEIADRSGYSVSGNFNNLLGKLRSCGAAEGFARDGGTKIADLFLE